MLKVLSPVLCDNPPPQGLVCFPELIIPTSVFWPLHFKQYAHDFFLIVSILDSVCLLAFNLLVKRFLLFAQPLTSVFLIYLKLWFYIVIILLYFNFEYHALCWPTWPLWFFPLSRKFCFSFINNDFAFNLIHYYFFYFNIELLLKYPERTVSHLAMTAYCLNILNNQSMLFCFVCGCDP